MTLEFFLNWILTLEFFLSWITLRAAVLCLLKKKRKKTRNMKRSNFVVPGGGGGGTSTTTKTSSIKWDKEKVSSLTNKQLQMEKCEEMMKRLRKNNNACFTCAGPGSLAPQYACVTFSTFICTRCAGIYREFGFRVKSVSASTFTPEEVNVFVCNGGNETARRRYFAKGKYDENKYPKPESSETNKIKGFVKAALVDKIWMSDGVDEGGKGGDDGSTTTPAPPDAKRTSLRFPYLSG